MANQQFTTSDGHAFVSSDANDFYVAPSVYALFAQGLLAGALEISVPAMGQVHNLVATGVAAGAPTVNSAKDLFTTADGHVFTGSDGEDVYVRLESSVDPSISQIHVINATSISCETPVVPTPLLEQIHAIMVKGIVAGSPGVSTPAMGQVHGLTYSDLTAGVPAIPTVRLGQEHALLISATITAQSPTLSSPPLRDTDVFAGGSRTVSVLK